MKQFYSNLKLASRKSIIVLATAFLPLLLQSIASPTYTMLFIYAQQQQQQSASGWGDSILPGDVPTLFSFNATKDKNGKVSGIFECFAVMPDGKTMYVNGTVTDLTFNETSVIISGPTVVTGFGAGVGTYKAIATLPEGQAAAESDNNASNGTLILTTDVNGDGIQGSRPDGSEGPFNEIIVRGSIKIVR
jgi:hypothetical protein